MFMFRLMIYLYDLRHEEKLVAKGGAATARPAVQPASVWARLSYFFLLPNVLFLLFPIVDYRTYRRTYYDRKPQEIYQQGIWWIALGLVHLLVYRLVYHYLVPMPEEVQGLGGVVRFLLSAYLIYLRVSGQFHLIIGLLCLFGFNLPPAHKFFLLASSFTDFWRRARIEWKDFMVKVFYYPALVPLQRKLGALPALVVTTVWVFIATWLLHSVQWFWLRGDFRLSATDGVFWTAIGGCVLVNSVLETVRGRARSKAASEWTVGPAIVHALKVMGMITFLCFLWSYWSSPSVAFWLSFLSAAKESGPGAYALLAAALLAVLAAGVLAQYIAARISVMSAARGRQQSPRTLMWRPALVVTAAVLLLAVRMPASQSALGSPIAGVVTSISTNRLNEVDQEREDRGYYEELLDEPRSTAAWLAATGSPPAEEPVENADDPMAAEPIDAAGPTPIGSADSVAAVPAATAPAPAGVDAGAADAPPSVKASQPREPVPSSETSMRATAPRTAPVTAPAVTPNLQRPAG